MKNHDAAALVQDKENSAESAINQALQATDRGAQNENLNKDKKTMQPPKKKQIAEEEISDSIESPSHSQEEENSYHH